MLQMLWNIPTKSPTSWGFTVPNKKKVESAHSKWLVGQLCRVPSNAGPPPAKSTTSRPRPSRAALTKDVGIEWGYPMTIPLRTDISCNIPRISETYSAPYQVMNIAIWRSWQANWNPEDCKLRVGLVVDHLILEYANWAVSKCICPRIGYWTDHIGYTLG